MFNLGLFEMTLFGVIALIVLGPDKLPEAARALGRWYAFFKNAKEKLQSEVINELHLLETQEQIKQELAKLKATESELKSQIQTLQASVEQNRKELIDHSFSLGTLFDENQNTQLTKPMTGQFFLLSDYDKKRRQPNAPLLPSHQADDLLNIK